MKGEDDDAYEEHQNNQPKHDQNSDVGVIAELLMPVVLSPFALKIKPVTQRDGLLLSHRVRRTRRLLVNDCRAGKFIKQSVRNIRLCGLRYMSFD